MNFGSWNSHSTTANFDHISMHRHAQQPNSNWFTHIFHIYNFHFQHAFSHFWRVVILLLSSVVKVFFWNSEMEIYGFPMQCAIISSLNYVLYFLSNIFYPQANSFHIANVVVATCYWFQPPDWLPLEVVEIRSISNFVNGHLSTVCFMVRWWPQTNNSSSTCQNHVLHFVG